MFWQVNILMQILNKIRGYTSVERQKGINTELWFFFKFIYKKEKKKKTSWWRWKCGNTSSIHLFIYLNYLWVLWTIICGYYLHWEIKFGGPIFLWLDIKTTFSPKLKGRFSSSGKNTAQTKIITLKDAWQALEVQKPRGEKATQSGEWFLFQRTTTTNKLKLLKKF